jgi:hypothetical protein
VRDGGHISTALVVALALAAAAAVAAGRALWRRRAMIAAGGDGRDRTT